MTAYAKILEDDGHLEEASQWYVLATRSDPPFHASCYNVAQVFLRLGRPEAAVAHGLAALENGCHAYEELVGPIALGLAVEGQWLEAEDLVAGADRDPRGQIKVVQVTAAAARGDLDPLNRMAGTLDPRHPLVQQVHSILQAGGARAAVDALDRAGEQDGSESGAL